MTVGIKQHVLRELDIWQLEAAESLPEPPPPAPNQPVRVVTSPSSALSRIDSVARLIGASAST